MMRFSILIVAALMAMGVAVADVPGNSAVCRWWPPLPKATAPHSWLTISPTLGHGHIWAADKVGKIYAFADAVTCGKPQLARLTGVKKSRTTRAAEQLTSVYVLLECASLVEA